MRRACPWPVVTRRTCLARWVRIVLCGPATHFAPGRCLRAHVAALLLLLLLLLRRRRRRRDASGPNTLHPREAPRARRLVVFPRGWHRQHVVAAVRRLLPHPVLSVLLVWILTNGKALQLVVAENICGGSLLLMLRLNVLLHVVLLLLLMLLLLLLLLLLLHRGKRRMVHRLHVQLGRASFPVLRMVLWLVRLVAKLPPGRRATWGALVRCWLSIGIVL